MVTLEQVKLLETKVAKAINFVRQVTEENNALKGKVDSYERRIDELEILIHQFKEDQSRIEDGILSALDRLNQFEDAIEKSLAPVKHEPERNKPPVSPEPKAAPPEKTPEPDDGGDDLDPLWQDIPPLTAEPEMQREVLPREEPPRELAPKELVPRELDEEDPINTGEDTPNDQVQNNTELDIF
ncbi:MAG: cell division protein ZapB [Treponema sp.]|jgi:hypothetical protein|nr:cell division protein ZapB [Treponema sp.]